MKLILTLIMMSSVTLAMQTCSKSSTVAKPDVVKTNTNITTNTNAVTTAPAAAADDAPRISLEDAKKDFDKENVLFIDTRAEAAYKVEHIKGSINIPLNSVEARYKELPKDKKIIAYCS